MIIIYYLHGIPAESIKYGNLDVKPCAQKKKMCFYINRFV